MQKLGDFETLAPLEKDKDIVYYKEEDLLIKTSISDYPSIQTIAELEYEYSIFKKFQNPLIIQAKDYIQEHNRHFLIFEDFQGKPLKNFIEEKKGLKLELFYPIALQLAQLLALIHQKNIIHQAFNPKSIWINPQTLQIKLIDFRKSSELSFEISSMDLTKSLDYLSPEQLGRTNRVVDYRTDFYTLGITFYEMLAGHLPFQQKDPLSLIYAHLATSPPPIQNIPPMLNKMIQKLMSKNGEDRYASATGIQEDLKNLIQQKKENQELEFELGKKDFNPNFQISQKLYGREEQVQQILSLFQTFMEKGESQILLISGPSGMGKTFLIQEIHKPLLSQKGLFIKGKYDILQKQEPYFGFAQAIKELLHYLLSQNNFEQLKKEFNEAVGSTGQVLVDIVPDLQLLLQNLPSVEPLPAKESQNRLHSTFERALKCIAKKESPLIIFLDDLQGVDQASMDLIHYLIDSVPYLFFVGSYRASEVTDLHPLMLTLKEVRNKTFISLKPLKEEEIEALLKDTLKRSEVSSLAKQILSKTAGNPFFVKEFLKACHGKGSIFFTEGEWSYNFQQIESAKITENVVDLMMQKIDALPVDCRDVLCLAACIGGTFESKTLAIITQNDEVSLAKLLGGSIQAGLIFTEGSDYKLAKFGQNITYKFIHDKVQEAAYQLISKDKKPIHLKVARLLSEQKGDSLFDIVDHYNKSFIEDPVEKEKVAKLNLQAAKKAKLSNAYTIALSYIKVARELVGESHFEIEKEFGECLSFAGHFDEAEEKLLALLEKAPNKLEKMKIFTTLATQNCNRGKLNETLSNCIQGLKEIDIKIPTQPTLLHLLTTFIHFQISLWRGKKSLKTISENPLMQETNRLFGIMGAACYLAKKDFLLILSTLKSIQHGLDSGCSSGASTYCNYAVLLITLNQFKQAKFWQELALWDAAQRNSSLLNGRTFYLHSTFYVPWFDPINRTDFVKAAKSILESGDFTYLGFCQFQSALYTFLAGQSLKETNQEFEKAIQVFQRSREDHLEAAEIIHSFALSLQKGNSQISRDKIKQVLEKPFKVTLRHYICSLYSGVLIMQNEFEEAYKYSVLSLPYSDSTRGQAIGPFAAYFYVLSACSRYSHLSKEEKKSVKGNFKKIKSAAKQCPINYLHLYLHLKAEFYAIHGNSSKAASYFEEAFNHAEKGHFSAYAAIISERAAHFYSHQKKYWMAKNYCRVSRYHYLQWGAQAKVKQLEQRYPDWFESAALTFATTGELLDFKSIVKMAESLSSELILENLLEKAIQIIKENAGAEKILILLEQEGELLLEADQLQVYQGPVKKGNDPTDIHVYQGKPLNERELPSSLMNYVFRTKEAVWLDDASNENHNFSRDPYIRQHSLKSVLCLPLIYLNKVMGVIYLENNLIPQAFTKERIEVLKVIASQAAISLENARLYAATNKLKLHLAELSEQPGNEEMLKTLQKAIVKLETTSYELNLLKQQNEEPIAIVGMGCRFPGGANNPEAFWELLKQGYDGMSEIPKDRWNVDAYYDPNKDAQGKMYVRKAGFLNVPIDQFDPQFFGISSHEAEWIDPQQRLLLEVTWEALENGGINPKELKGTSAGVFIGVMMHDYLDLLTKYGPDDRIDGYQVTGNATCVLPGRISYLFGLQGPSFPIDTACSSSLVALHSACQSLRAGECNLAIVGGVNVILTPEPFIQMCQARMLSSDGYCKTFDAKADGYARGEGCGIVILKRLSDAQKNGDRIIGLIKGSGVNQDGASSGLTVPNGQAQEALLLSVWAKAKIEANQISYVEAHGTGTSLGDPIEVNALASAFNGRREKNHPVWISSVKTHIGHLESAAGIAGIIKVLLSMQNGAIPPHSKLEKVNPHIQLESIPAKIPTELVPWNKDSKGRIAVVSAFGIGGTNAHAILAEAPSQTQPEKVQERPLHILVLSARSEKALKDLLISYRDYLEKDFRESLEDIAYTANTGRAHFEFRTTFIVKTRDELLNLLKKENYTIQKIPQKKPKLTLSFKEAKMEEFWGNLGIVSDGDEMRVEIKGNGWEEVLGVLSKLYLNGFEINWKALDAPYPRKKVALPTYPFQRKHCWAKVLEQKETHQPVLAGKEPLEEKGTLFKELQGLLPNEKKEAIKKYLKEKICQILELPSDHEIDENAGYFELGLDSFMALEIRNQLQRDLGSSFELATTLFFDYPTLSQLADHLESLVLFAPTEKKGRGKASYQGEPIAIISASCRFPGGITDLDTFWELLKEGKDGIEVIPSDRWDIDKFYSPIPDQPGKIISRFGGFLKHIDQFDAEFFGISTREAEMMDPQQRIVLESAWEALEMGGYDPTSLRDSLTGVYIGVSLSDYMTSLLKNSGPDDQEFYIATGTALSAISGRVSFALGLQGPSLSIDSACSSSLVAVHQACQGLRNGEIDLAIAGGVNVIISPDVNILFSRGHVLAPDGHCKTFDARADGYVRSEGCGIVILKRLEDALKDGDNIFAVVKGSSVNQDGKSGGLTVPNGTSQELLMRQALEAAQVMPEEVQYIEAHGTGTPLGDPIEVNAIGNVYGSKSRQNPLWIGTVKTNIGHTESAAGIAGLIKTVLALKHGLIPKNLNFETLNPQINLDKIPAAIPQETIDWPNPRKAAVSSFGFAGTLAHAILEEAPPKRKREANIDRPLHLLTLSAKDFTALDEKIETMQKFLKVNPDLNVADVAFTCNTGRTHFKVRHAVSAATTDELMVKLQDKPVQMASKKGPIAFLFAGQGSQYKKMGEQLYQTQPVFKKALDRCAELLEGELDKPLLALLMEETDLLDQTKYTQPVLFAIEYALAELWKSWGVNPDYVMGHSVGEYTAAAVSGIVSLEDGLKLIAARGRLMQALPPGGAMLALKLNLETVLKTIEACKADVDIGAVNGPEQTVISGKESEVNKIADFYRTKEVKMNRLHVSHASHSKLMDPMLEEFGKVAETVTYHLPKMGFVSNLTGQVIREKSLNAKYWIDHIRNSVRFSQGIQSLYAEGCEIFIEVSPHPILLGIGMQCLPEGKGIWLPSLRREHGDWDTILSSLSQFYAHGGDVDWRGFDTPYQREKLVLPTYPFQRKSYWAKSLHRAVSIPTEAPKVVQKRESLLHKLQKVEDRSEKKGILTNHLTSLVGKILRVSKPLDQTQNFFDCGMDSLMAMELRNHLLADLEKKYPFPLTLVIEHSTIEKLANYFDLLLNEQKVEREAKLSVPIQEKGSHLPLFCIHPMGGDIFDYVDLSKALGEDYPLYGIRAAGLEDTQTLPNSLEAMAKLYIAAIKEIQPKGPYSVLGWSFGSILAVEIISQLEQMGEANELLVCLDMPDLFSDPLFQKLSTEEILLNVLNVERDAHIEISEEEFANSDVQTVRNLIITRAQKEGVFPTDVEFVDLQRRVGVIANNIEIFKQCLLHYTPQPFSHVKRIYLFEAEHGLVEMLKRPGPSKRLDVKSSGFIEKQILPGNHHEVVLPPQISQIAQAAKWGIPYKSQV